MIVLSNFTKSITPAGVNISGDVEIDNDQHQVVFEIIIDADSAAKIKPNPISFVLAMLIPAMERGENIHVKAALDGALLHQLNTYAISVIHNKYVSCRPIKITCDEEVVAQALPKPLGAMTGMSCGVDSLRTLMMYGGNDNDITETYRLKNLAVFDVGAFSDSAIEYPRILEKAGEIAKKSGCRVIGVSTNITQFHDGAHRTNCSIKHAACAYSLIDIIDVYMVSSAYEWDIISAKELWNIAIEGLDPILLPMLSNARLKLFSAAANETRYQKTIEIIQNSPFISTIDTCTRPAFKRDVEKNCGSCQKCGEILLIAESLGKLDVIAPYFNMEAFRKRRFRIFQRMFTQITLDKANCPEFVPRHLGHLTHEVDVPFGAVFTGILVGKLTLLVNFVGLGR